MFFPIYFSEYIKYPWADFHKKIFKITDDQSAKISALLTFRGSGKSTIVTLSYPIWAIVGVQQKKFVLIISRTEQLAKMHMANLKRELESNELLRQDLGPFEEQNEEWNSGSLVISKYNARITVVSIDQSIRGIRHASHRPDLIICDDVEDLASVKTLEGRQKTLQWFAGDVIPAGDKNTKIIVVGNLLHEQSLLMHLKEKIVNREINANFLEVPIISEEGEIAWPGKFRSMEEIEDEKKNSVDEGAWSREYMLRIISDAGRVVHPEWLKCYSGFPSDDNLLFTITGVDLAISEKNSADYTAMVSANVYKLNGELSLYILPNPVNERLTFPETVERIKMLSKSLGNGYPTEMAIEDVGYQKALIQGLQDEGFPVEGFAVKGQDKRARLALTTHMIKSGHVLFPKKGTEKLIHQLTGFGSEKHDDLADAFTIAVLHSIKKGEEYMNEPEIFLA